LKIIIKGGFIALLDIYFKNFETKGDVSPLLKKCPDGPSPKNSENHDSCSISSFNIAKDKSYVL